MYRQSLIGVFVVFAFVIFCGGCCPEISSMQVSALPSDSGRTFVADCGEEITIQWQIANEGDIESQYIKFLYPSLFSDILYRYEDQPLTIDQREFTFTFKRPVTLQLTVKCKNGRTKSVVWLDFLAKDYYFNATFACNHHLCSYPELCFGSNPEITIDFIQFVAFYDDGSLGESRIIDYLKENDMGPGPFAMRTIVPAKEHREQCYEDSDAMCSLFDREYGYNYDYAEVNAMVFGGAFAKHGSPFPVITDKGTVKMQRGNTEIVEPIFCTVLLSDSGEWTKEGDSEAQIIDIQLGNKTQGLVLIYDTRFLPAGVVTTLGSIQTATIDYPPLSAIPTIRGGLKSAQVGFYINLENSPLMGIVTDAIPEASWYMPYLPDVANLESVCGE